MRKFLLLLVLVAALVLDVAGQASDATRSDASSNAEAAVKALEDRLAAGGSAPVKAVTRKTRAGVKKVAPCSELDAIEKILPDCDITDSKTRKSIECRTLLKGAAVKELGTAIEVGGIRGARFILPATTADGQKVVSGQRVKMGGAGHGSLFESKVTPADVAKPVGFTLRAFHGAAPIGQRINMTARNFEFLGMPDNLAGGVTGVLTEQCDEIKLQPGTRAVCGVCLLSADNLDELAVEADATNKEVVTLPLEDGDEEYGVIVSGAAGARLGVVAAMAAVAAAVALF